ncbi:MAG: hypothetical protein DLM60_19835 [Pseudonocardiales bacterium]|nr:MAG: hypothetical protein DLM60_19835 [Pseudonocardiales bacterium]
MPPDPFDLALVHSGEMDEQALGQVASDRREALLARQNSVRHLAEETDPWLTEAERMTIEHLIGRLAAEVRWHEQLLDRLPKIVADHQARRDEYS